MFNSACKTCGKKFESQRKDSESCYRCALERITGGNPPEEGDFNAALIVSGEMSDRQAWQLQKDLESIDHSVEEEFERRLVEDYSDRDTWYEEDDEWTR